MTRRELVRRGLVVGAAATVTTRAVLRPERAFGAVRSGAQPSIAVIGAGISGLTAAMTLRDAGFRKVTVYDADTRIGGRTWTRSGDGFWEHGQWSEWGGELIDTDHALMHSLARRYGFHLYDLDRASGALAGATDVLWFGGGYYRWDDMFADWRECGMDRIIARDLALLPEFPWAHGDAAWTPAGLALDRMSIREWIDTRVPGGHRSRLGAFLDVAYNVEYGEETSRQGAVDLLCLLGDQRPRDWWIYGLSDERWKIRGGNQQIPLAQADELGHDNIQLGWALTSLRRTSGGEAEVEFDVNGTRRVVRADRVVLAIPLGALKRLDAAGGLQALASAPGKAGFIRALGLGANTKLQLQLTDRRFAGSGPWGRSSGEAYSDTGFQQVWHASCGQPGRTAILNNYLGGDSARAVRTPVAFSSTGDEHPGADAAVRAAARRLLGQLEPVFPGIGATWTGKATLSAWHLGPHHHGAYSFWTPDYMHRYSTTEWRPVGPVHLAGEHCSSYYQGYMEGGAGEGQRAAAEIVKAYGRTRA